jgi:hypothetical protein
MPGGMFAFKRKRRMQKISFLESMIQGRIGNRFVIKHYTKYKVKTKVPDMSRIIPSKRQKRQRRLFRLAVHYAQSIYWNPTKRAEKERIYRRPWRLFQKLMKEWFRKREQRRYAAQRRITIWKRNVALNKGNEECKPIRHQLSSYVCHTADRCPYSYTPVNGTKRLFMK